MGMRRKEAGLGQPGSCLARGIETVCPHPYTCISADAGDGEEKVISQGKCISYLVALLEACQATKGRHEKLLIKM